MGITSTGRRESKIVRHASLRCPSTLVGAWRSSQDAYAWLYACDLTVNATAQAAIRRDRGAGIVWVDGGTYATSGACTNGRTLYVNGKAVKWATTSLPAVAAPAGARL
jgi:hypothetical protein